MRLHVAVLDEELPFPLTSGTRIRTFNLLSRLAQRHRITYLCHRNPDRNEQAEAERAFADLGMRCIAVDRQVPAKAGLGFYARLAANLFSPLPYSVATHRSAQLLHEAQQLTRDDPPDLWHCEWTPYAEYLRPTKPGRVVGDACGNIPWVVMAHNVESLIWERYFHTEKHPLKRWYIKKQFQKFERFEAWAYSACDTAIAVSDEDAQLIRSRFFAKKTTRTPADSGGSKYLTPQPPSRSGKGQPDFPFPLRGGAGEGFFGPKIAVVDNGVDTAYFAPRSHGPRDPYRILFLGSLDWRPNIDAVQVLLEQIFPIVRKREPRATLQVVGRKPGESLRRRIASEPGVELHANVPDVRPFLASAGMLAVPLRIGGGSRLKILEALASALPVVATPIGMEGLHLQAGQHLTCADTPVRFAEAVHELMNNRTVANQQALCGRQRVLERYDWAGLAVKMENIWLQSAGVGMLQNQLTTCLV
jgi:glycosyltransferase involved in cell wall biosynthesis